MCFLLSFCITFQVVYCMSPPTFISDWQTIESQSTAGLSRISIPHNLGIIPMKVDVQVKTTDITGNDIIFSAVGSGVRDNDLGLNRKVQGYGGIVYIYNERTVELFAPRGNSVDGTDNGRVIFITSADWTGTNYYDISRADIRVRLWSTDDFFKPFYISDQRSIDTGNALTFAHNYGDYPQMVCVKINITDNNGEMWISEGVGMSYSDYARTDDNSGGVVHAFDSTNIFVWASDKNVFSLVGWGNAAEEFTASSGIVQAYVWVDAPDSGVAHLGSYSLSLPEAISFDCSIVTSAIVKYSRIQLNKALIYGNMYFSPPSSLIYSSRAEYGGVIFAHTETTSYFWYPNGRNSEAMYMQMTAGGGVIDSTSMKYVVTFYIWNCIYPETTTGESLATSSFRTTTEMFSTSVTTLNADHSTTGTTDSTTVATTNTMKTTKTLTETTDITKQTSTVKYISTETTATADITTKDTYTTTHTNTVTELSTDTIVTTAISTETTSGTTNAIDTSTVTSDPTSVSTVTTDPTGVSTVTTDKTTETSIVTNISTEAASSLGISTITDEATTGISTVKPMSTETLSTTGTVGISTKSSDGTTETSTYAQMSTEKPNIVTAETNATTDITTKGTYTTTHTNTVAELSTDTVATTSISTETTSGTTNAIDTSTVTSVPTGVSTATTDKTTETSIVTNISTEATPTFGISTNTDEATTGISTVKLMSTETPLSARTTGISTNSGDGTTETSTYAQMSTETPNIITTGTNATTDTSSKLTDAATDTNSYTNLSTDTSMKSTNATIKTITVTDMSTATTKSMKTTDISTSIIDTITDTSTMTDKATSTTSTIEIQTTVTDATSTTDFMGVSILSTKLTSESISNHISSTESTLTEGTQISPSQMQSNTSKSSADKTCTCFRACRSQNIDINKIIADITIDVKTTSAYIRKKTSAQDDRPSAKCIGGLGIVILSGLMCMLVGFDLNRFYIHFRKDIKRIRKKYIL